MICDYEGSDYKTRFWKNSDRVYEDACERVALRRLLPPHGKRLADFGAGFGRLADLYAGYDEVILLDYSRSLLEEAQEHWGHDPRFRFVAADIYHLPFAGGVLEAATMVRVIHHIADVSRALGEIRRAIAPGSHLVLEFANKRNLKAVSRFALRRQDWSPFSLEPVEFATLNFDFHPRWMRRQLEANGFRLQRMLAVSYLRWSALKRSMPIKAMVYVDALLQLTSRLGVLSPSVFTLSENAVGMDDGQELSGDAIFRSPLSGLPLRRDGDTLVCDADGTRWHAQGAFYDFKEPM